MSPFDPISALLGGALIGLAATLLLLLLGRVAGVSGILAGALRPFSKEWAWRLAFVVGLPLGAFLTNRGFIAAGHDATAVVVTAPLVVVSIGGLLVGFGTRLGSGCTSGHGVCGLARFSKRSLAATMTFMATAAVTVFIIRHVVGGG